MSSTFSAAAPNVIIAVAGDLGRSTRMLNHARALAAAGASVTIVGLKGSTIPSDLEKDGVRVRQVPSFGGQRANGRFTFWLAAIARQILLSMVLAAPLLQARRGSILLIQNPPAFPLLPVALLIARVRRCIVVVDWHNFTSSMLRARPMAGATLPRIIGAIEVRLARRAAAHLCVSNTMKQRLSDEKIQAEAVPDAPTARFQPTAERPELPVIIVPGSWSADDDFDLLLEGLALLARDGQAFLLRLTGDGPARRSTLPRFERTSHPRVTIEWRDYPADDYPHALASATIGVSIHRSTSNADIPIKISEMSAAGLPVIALEYAAVIRETFDDRRDGILVTNAQELADAIEVLLAQQGRARPTGSRPTWEEQYATAVLPVFQREIERT